MTLADVGILIKKILVGIIVYLIPVIIIVGGLWLTSRILKTDKSAEAKDFTIKK